MKNTRRIRAIPSCAIALVSLCASGAQAQLAPANGAGVAMGQLHYFVDDLAANREFWLALGGEALLVGGEPGVRMPGVIVLLSEQDTDTNPAILDHVAFRVASLDAIEARGFTLERLEAFPGIASIRTPGGDRVELFEEGTATNVGFTPDRSDEVAERHNRALVGDLDSHHLHFYVPEDEVEAAQQWYVEHFGAVPGVRWRYAAADLPGMNLNFSAADGERAATRGTSLDHIGFEIDGLEAFCRELERRGIAFDEPYRRASAGMAVAVLTDPWGTTIELTEGLRRP